MHLARVGVRVIHLLFSSSPLLSSLLCFVLSLLLLLCAVAGCCCVAVVCLCAVVWLCCGCFSVRGNVLSISPYFLCHSSVLRNGRNLALKPTMGHGRKYVLKVFHSKEECDVRLPRAQGSVIATCVRTSKEARLCGSDRDEECIDQTAGTRSADYLRFLAEAEMRAADPDEYHDMVTQMSMISRLSLADLLLS